MIFNIRGNSLQYADDTNIFYYTKLNDLQPCIELANCDIEMIIDWSKQSNLVFNSKKTKIALFSHLR